MFSPHHLSRRNGPGKPINQRAPPPQPSTFYSPQPDPLWPKYEMRLGCLLPHSLLMLVERSGLAGAVGSYTPSGSNVDFCRFLILVLSFVRSPQTCFWHKNLPVSQYCIFSPSGTWSTAAMTLDEKAAQSCNPANCHSKTLAYPHYQTWNESLHGVARAGAQPCSRKRSAWPPRWDPDIVHSMGHVISAEARAKYNEAQREGNHRIFDGLTFWSPNINIFRDPRWGRGQETYGEDPFSPAAGCRLRSPACRATIRISQGRSPPRSTSRSTAGPERAPRLQRDVQPRDLDEPICPLPRRLTEGRRIRVMCAYNASTRGRPAPATRCC